MFRAHFGRYLVLGASLAMIAGCGSEGFTLAPVSGHVTVDGEPILGLRVSFEPIGGSQRPLPGPDSISITDAEGKYVLATTESQRQGAVVGPCRVRIWALPGNVTDRAVSDDRDPNYDPIAEIKSLKTQMRGTKSASKTAAKRPTGLIPLRFNDKTELTFEVTSEGTDKADFAISWK